MQSSSSLSLCLQPICPNRIHSDLSYFGSGFCSMSYLFLVWYACVGLELAWQLLTWHEAAVAVLLLSLGLRVFVSGLGGFEASFHAFVYQCFSPEVDFYVGFLLSWCLYPSLFLSEASERRCPGNRLRLMVFVDGKQSLSESVLHWPNRCAFWPQPYSANWMDQTLWTQTSTELIQSQNQCFPFDFPQYLDHQWFSPYFSESASRILCFLFLLHCLEWKCLCMVIWPVLVIWFIHLSWRWRQSTRLLVLRLRVGWLSVVDLRHLAIFVSRQGYLASIYAFTKTSWFWKPPLLYTNWSFDSQHFSAFSASSSSFPVSHSAASW